MFSDAPMPAAVKRGGRRLRIRPKSGPMVKHPGESAEILTTDDGNSQANVNTLMSRKLRNEWTTNKCPTMKPWERTRSPQRTKRSQNHMRSRKPRSLPQIRRVCAGRTCVCWATPTWKQGRAAHHTHVQNFSGWTRHLGLRCLPPSNQSILLCHLPRSNHARPRQGSDLPADPNLHATNK